MPTPVPHDVQFFATPDELRAWLEAHHDIADELWLGYHRKASGRPTVTWEQVVDEALCYGWIDGVRQRLEEGSAQRLTPRRPGSIWSARNVARVAALRAEGRMRPAGDAAFARRRDDRTAIYSFEAGRELDEAAEAAIRTDPEAWAFWEAQPRGYRRVGSHWVMSAKRPETRARRIAALAAACARGERLVALTGASRRPRTEDP